MKTILWRVFFVVAVNSNVQEAPVGVYLVVVGSNEVALGRERVARPNKAMSNF